jgi:aminoglycoside phosphotransferase
VSAVAEAPATLAPDPSVPQRDLLLDPRAVAERLERRLGVTGRLTIPRCERVRAKYQVGRSLRVLHRIEVDGASRLVAARTFAAGRSEDVSRRAAAAAVPSGALRSVAHDPEIATVFWSFPNDRKITTLRALVDPPDELARALPARWTRSELAAYAPEKSATARWVGADGRGIAFAKVYAGSEGERTSRVHAALAARAGGDAALAVAPALGYSRRYRTLLMQPVAGRPVAELAGAELERGLRALGAALAALHRAPLPAGLPRARRLTPDRLAHAAAVLAAGRPDVAGRVRAIADALRDSFDGRAATVCLHGDAHPKNAILGAGGVVLIDLDQVCEGPASADLGGLLAALTYARCVGRLSEEAERRLGDAVLAGYAEAATPPPPDSVRWHQAAALLAERALRSVERVRLRGLARLDAVLDAAEASCR